MVTLLLITAAWILAALATGVGVGRIIARADVDDEMAGLVRESRP
jgi:hypothetical protein